MGKASSSKKVSRAASTGGGRTARGTRPWGWYLAMALVSVLGVATIVVSRNERQAASNPAKAEKPRPAGKDGRPIDHWHAAYGVYLCDAFAGNIRSEKDPLGIHTHDDGVIHIHPFTRAASGRRATLGKFTDTVGMTLGDDKLKLPGGKTYRNGDRCGKKEGRVRVFLNGDERRGDPKKIRLRDRDLLVIAFAPSNAEVPEKPPSASQLDRLNDVPGSPGLTTPTSAVPVPGEGAGTTAPPAGEPSTSAPPVSSP